MRGWLVMMRSTHDFRKRWPLKDRVGVGQRLFCAVSKIGGICIRDGVRAIQYISLERL